MQSLAGFFLEKGKRKSESVVACRIKPYFNAMVQLPPSEFSYHQCPKCKFDRAVGQKQRAWLHLRYSIKESD